MGKDEAEVADVLEGMADKGLCMSLVRDGTRYYSGLPFVPGIFEYQFMRGTETERDKTLAKLIHAYKTTFDATVGPPKIIFPVERVITVDRKVKAGNTVHTYDQMASYVETYDPISVGTCFCRHEAKLLDEEDDCGMPNDVCMQFGPGAQFMIERGISKKVTKEEALDVLRRSEEAGLVHCSPNAQEIEFVCNCCSCHCMILKTALAQPKPGLALTSGFQPAFDADLCTACETCVERCPTDALALGQEDIPEVDLDRCIGCGVCATGCPSEAIEMVERLGMPVPPVDRKGLREALKALRH
jgi:Pyruvate/2-oxoacid:ferredoxin oxidoreductase delta subunit